MWVKRKNQQLLDGTVLIIITLLPIFAAGLANHLPIGGLITSPLVLCAIGKGFNENGAVSVGLLPIACNLAGHKR